MCMEEYKGSLRSWNAKPLWHCCSYGIAETAGCFFLYLAPPVLCRILHADVEATSTTGRVAAFAMEGMTPYIDLALSFPFELEPVVAIHFILYIQ